MSGWRKERLVSLCDCSKRIWRGRDFGLGLGQLLDGIPSLIGYVYQDTSKVDKCLVIYDARQMHGDDVSDALAPLFVPAENRRPI